MKPVHKTKPINIDAGLERRHTGLERKRPACYAVEKRQTFFRAAALNASGTLALQSFDLYTSFK